MNESGKIDHDDEKPGKSASSPGRDDDDFELTAEMMIHDFDDETTLNEDEDDIDTNEDELADLAKEGEMPLEELLARYYGGATADAGTVEAEEDGEDDSQSENEEDSKEGETPRRTLRSTAVTLNPSVSGSDSDDEEKKAALHDEERKKPRIGEEYQVAKIPDAKIDRAEKYKYDDLQVWTPWKVPEDAVVEFLKEVSLAACPNITREDADSATFVQDNEDALFLLRQCENDPEEALRRYKTRPSPLNNEIQIWSEEECREFEDGLAIYGKDFYLIHLNKVRTRSVKDIVKFYYIWKKSERFDQFAAKTRLGKKKELLPANVTDYMERLLDETDKACTASIMNHNSGNYLKYCAHSVALMEHLKRLEEANFSDRDGEIENILSNANEDPLRSDVHVEGTSTDTAHLQKKIKVNSSNNNNNTESLKQQDLNQVLTDLVESSSGIG